MKIRVSKARIKIVKKNDLLGNEMKLKLTGKLNERREY